MNKSTGTTPRNKGIEVLLVTPVISSYCSDDTTFNLIGVAVGVTKSDATAAITGVAVGGTGVGNAMTGSSGVSKVV